MDNKQTVFDLIGEVQAASQRAEIGAQISKAKRESQRLDGSYNYGAGSGGAQHAQLEEGLPPAAPVVQTVVAPSTRGFSIQNFMSVVSGLQFAVVILIAQRRIPDAERVEFFVVLAMLMVTAANAKILELLPDGSTIINDCEAIKFIVLGIPIFFFIMLIEVWFLSYLFRYDPAVQLSSFKNNAQTILSVATALTITKIVLITTVRIFIPILKTIRKKRIPELRKRLARQPLH